MLIKEFKKSADPVFSAKNLILAINQPSFPLDLEEIALNVGIQEVKYMNTDKFEGMLIALPDKSAGFINISNNIREQTRKRFTIAHELGHFLITTHINNYECSSYDTNNYSDKTKPQEIEAKIEDKGRAPLMARTSGKTCRSSMPICFVKDGG